MQARLFHFFVCMQERLVSRDIYLILVPKGCVSMVSSKQQTLDH